eukprot:SAG22_NODE_10857_length_513_cov_0.857488_1_plen_112_part_01
MICDDGCGGGTHGQTAADLPQEEAGPFFSGPGGEFFNAELQPPAGSEWPSETSAAERDGMFNTTFGGGPAAAHVRLPFTSWSKHVYMAIGDKESWLLMRSVEPTLVAPATRF